MKVLFIGGTGNISSAYAQVALEHGMDVTLFNRGETQVRPAPDGAQVIHSDIRDPESAKRVLAGQKFDVVADFVAFTPDHVQADIDLFGGRAGQYIFISSASAYQKPPANLPITESTPLRNPFWEYSRNKIACEDLLTRAYRECGFPMTIVRPSHTYDRTRLPFDGGYTVVDRMRRGKKVVVHGDGTSLWPLTHSRDLARAFVGLLGNPHTLGESYQITSDEVLTWNQIFDLVAEAAGVEAEKIHLSSELIAACGPRWGDGYVADKAHCFMFDNSKIKRAVPGWVATISFAQGAREVMAWYDADPARRLVNEEADALYTKMVAVYEGALAAARAA